MREARRELARRLGRGPVVVLSGGDAERLLADLEGAEAALTQGVHLAVLWAAPPQQAYGQLLQARLRLARSISTHWLGLPP